MTCLAGQRQELALELIAEDALWSAARVGVVTQVGAWYNVCSVTKEERIHVGIYSIHGVFGYRLWLFFHVQEMSGFGLDGWCAVEMYGEKKHGSAEVDWLRRLLLVCPVCPVGHR